MIETTDDTFENDVAKGKLLVMFTNGCANCRKVQPILEAIEKENPEIVFVKAPQGKTDSHAIAHGMQGASLPGVFAYVDGKKVNSSFGVQTKVTFLNLFDPKFKAPSPAKMRELFTLRVLGSLLSVNCGGIVSMSGLDLRFDLALLFIFKGGCSVRVPFCKSCLQ